MNTVLFDIQTKVSELNNINSKLNSLNYDTESINAKLKEKAEQMEKLNNDIISKEAELNRLAKQISEFQAELSELEDNVVSKETVATVSSLDYTSYDSYTSEECKNELYLLKQQEKELIKENVAVCYSSENSKKQNFDNGKQILSCLNAECDNVILSISVKNIDTLRNKIVNSYESLNKIFAVDGIALTKEMLEFKLKELTLIHSYEKKHAEEREIQKAIKEQRLEKERVRKELEKRKQEDWSRWTELKNKAAHLFHLNLTSML